VGHAVQRQMGQTLRAVTVKQLADVRHRLRSNILFALGVTPVCPARWVAALQLDSRLLQRRRSAHPWTRPTLSTAWSSGTCALLAAAPLCPRSAYGAQRAGRRRAAGAQITMVGKIVSVAFTDQLARLEVNDSTGTAKVEKYVGDEEQSEVRRCGAGALLKQRRRVSRARRNPLQRAFASAGAAPDLGWHRGLRCRRVSGRSCSGRERRCVFACACGDVMVDIALLGLG